MPAVKIGLDIDTRKLISSTGTTLQTFSAKKGSIIDFELAIRQNGIALNLPSSSTVEFALKKTTAPAGTYLYNTSATPSGWGTGSRWFFRMDLSGAAFDDDTVIGKALDAEVLMELPDGQRIASLTTSFTVLKNVIT